MATTDSAQWYCVWWPPTRIHLQHRFSFVWPVAATASGVSCSDATDTSAVARQPPADLPGDISAKVACTLPEHVKPQQPDASLCLLCRWLAPEVLAGKSYDCASDVYSFGMILWEMMTWQVPWEELGPWQVGFC